MYHFLIINSNGSITKANSINDKDRIALRHGSIQIISIGGPDPYLMGTDEELEKINVR